MKITREEFKELVKLYNETFELGCKASNFLQDDVVDRLVYPAMEWIVKKLDIADGDWDLLFDLYMSKTVPVHWDYDENGVFTNVVYSDDLDVIYDTYLNGK